MKTSTLITALATGLGLAPVCSAAFEKNVTIDLSAYSPNASFNILLTDNASKSGDPLTSMASTALKDSLDAQFKAIFAGTAENAAAMDDCDAECCYNICALLMWFPPAGWGCCEFLNCFLRVPFCLSCPMPVPQKKVWLTIEKNQLPLAMPSMDRTRGPKGDVDGHHDTKPTSSIFWRR